MKSGPWDKADGEHLADKHLEVGDDVRQVVEDIQGPACWYDVTEPPWPQVVPTKENMHGLVALSWFMESA